VVSWSLPASAPSAAATLRAPQVSKASTYACARYTPGMRGGRDARRRHESALATWIAAESRPYQLGPPNMGPIWVAWLQAAGGGDHVLHVSLYAPGSALDAGQRP
jgi:hypothetical protein